MMMHTQSTFSNEGGGSFRPKTARQNNHDKAENFPTSGNIGLAQSLKFAGLSRSKGYQYGLIPIYDDDGHRIDEGKVAPVPWLPMPDSIIRAPGQKKIFLAEEIRAWRDAITDRSRLRDPANINKTNALIKRGDNRHEQQ